MNWQTTEHFVLLVDLMLLGGLYALALKSRSYYPLWMTGFQFVATLTHISTMLASKFLPEIYRAFGTLWAVPITLALIWGVRLDRKAKTKAPRT